MSPEENVERVKRYYEEIFNQGHMERVDEFVDPDFTNHDHPPGFTPPRGAKGAVQFWDMVHEAFPDMQVEIEITVAEGDLVCEHSVIRATHGGDWMGVPPTGKPVTWDMTNLYKLSNGKLTDRWGAFDQMALMQQMGVMPSRRGNGGGE
jgi:predicted ester cyclase